MFAFYFASPFADGPRNMSKQAIRHPDKTNPAGAYSAAVVVDGWVYLSGIGPVDPHTGQAVRGSIENETHHVLGQLERILGAAGCTRHDVVKCTVHLADIEDFDRFNVSYRDFFKDVAVLPARTTVQSVLWNQIKVEIDCVAKQPQIPP